MRQPGLEDDDDRGQLGCGSDPLSDARFDHLEGDALTFTDGPREHRLVRARRALNLQGGSVPLEDKDQQEEAKRRRHMIPKMARTAMRMTVDFIGANRGALTVVAFALAIAWD